MPRFQGHSFGKELWQRTGSDGDDVVNFTTALSLLDQDNAVAQHASYDEYLRHSNDAKSSPHRRKPGMQTLSDLKQTSERKGPGDETNEAPKGQHTGIRWEEIEWVFSQNAQQHVFAGGWLRHRWIQIWHKWAASGGEAEHHGVMHALRQVCRPNVFDADLYACAITWANRVGMEEVLSSKDDTVQRHRLFAVDRLQWLDLQRWLEDAWDDLGRGPHTADQHMRVSAFHALRAWQHGLRCMQHQLWHVWQWLSRVLRMALIALPVMLLWPGFPRRDVRGLLNMMLAWAWDMPQASDIFHAEALVTAPGFFGWGKYLVCLLMAPCIGVAMLLGMVCALIEPWVVHWIFWQKQAQAIWAEDTGWMGMMTSGPRSLCLGALSVLRRCALVVSDLLKYLYLAVLCSIAAVWSGLSACVAVPKQALKVGWVMLVATYVFLTLLQVYQPAFWPGMINVGVMLFAGWWQWPLILTQFCIVGSVCWWLGIGAALWMFRNEVQFSKRQGLIVGVGAFLGWCAFLWMAPMMLAVFGGLSTVSWVIVPVTMPPLAYLWVWHNTAAGTALLVSPLELCRFEQSTHDKHPFNKTPKVPGFGRSGSLERGRGHRPGGR